MAYRTLYSYWVPIIINLIPFSFRYLFNSLCRNSLNYSRVISSKTGPNPFPFFDGTVYIEGNTRQNAIT
jgi:hypothetical protein